VFDLLTPAAPSSSPWDPAEDLDGAVSCAVSPDRDPAIRRVADIHRGAVSDRAFVGSLPMLPPVTSSSRRPRRAELLIRLLCHLNC
jgi:hypothetical protein